MKSRPFFLFALLLIVLDQASKLLVHKYMAYGLPGEIHLLGNWFKLHYTLNPGMAFGLTLGDTWGKLFLSLFRLVATAGIGYFLWQKATERAHKGFLYCIAAIFAGALGNVIDSTFYGVFLNNAPEGAPFAWFHGQVIDMIFVDIWEGPLPNWIPVLGGQWYSLWPIFNIADSCIFVGLGTILVFQNRFLKTETTPSSSNAATPTA